MITADITTADRWYVGADQQFVFTVYQAGTTQAAIDAGTATAQNISGWALSWTVKRKASDLDVAAILTKTTVGGGIVLTTPASGVCTVTVADTDTDGLTPGEYLHELKRTDAGYESVLSAGLAVLLRGLHRT